MDESLTAEQLFIDYSASGELDTVLPEWQRMRSSLNTQHSTHDFTLDVHTAKVLVKTKQSVSFQALSTLEKRLVCLAALLHDIAKQGGPAGMVLQPDRPHPIKSTTVAYRWLATLPLTWSERFLVCRLIRFHQLFGAMIIVHKHKGQDPELAVYRQAALTLKTRQTLRLLKPLTEGDIRGVKADDVLFDARVEEKLALYSEEVDKALRELEARYCEGLDVNAEGLVPVSISVKDAEYCSCDAWQLESDRLYCVSNQMDSTTKAFALPEFYVKAPVGKNWAETLSIKAGWLMGEEQSSHGRTYTANPLVLSR